MVVDLCEKCSRPGFLYGTCDAETGWQGWCGICNVNWRYQRCKNTVASSGVMQKYCGPSSSNLLLAVVDFLVPRTLLRSLHEKVRIRLWYRSLGFHCSCTPEVMKEDGTFSEADSEDELEDGVLDAALTFRNPLVKLQLARSLDDDKIGRPAFLLLQMIGVHPWMKNR